MWFTESKLGAIPVAPRFLLASLVGLVVGALFAALVELVMIRPLYGRHIEQVLVTVGLALCATALVTAIWGNDAQVVARRRGRARRRPSSAPRSRTTAGSRSSSPLAVLFALDRFLRKTRYGLIVRAGVENRSMVTALGIDVRKCVHARLRDRRARRRARRRPLRHLLRHVDPQRGRAS